MPPVMIGGGAKRILGIAGEHADIVSINFNNSAERLALKVSAGQVQELTKLSGLRQVQVTFL